MTYILRETDFDVLQKIKDVADYNQSLSLRQAPLDEMIDRFGDWTEELGQPWDRGVDLGIYLHHRLGRNTRKEIAEALVESSDLVLNSIKKAERWLKKNDQLIKDNFFSFISAIEGAGYCFPTTHRPFFDFLPEAEAFANGIVPLSVEKVGQKKH